MANDCESIMSVCSFPREDHDLVAQAVAGDVAAFEVLVRRHEGRVYRTAMAITCHLEDAEDVMQETFLKAYKNLREFKQQSLFSTWLTRIAVNESLQKLRCRRETTPLEESVLEGGNPMPVRVGEWYADPESRYAAGEMRCIVEQAIASLPAAYRAVFVLRDMEGLSTEEAAEALGLGVPALKSRLLRARLMMRESLAARFEMPPTLKSRMRYAYERVRDALMMGFERPDTEG